MAYLIGYECAICGEFQPLPVCQQCAPFDTALIGLVETVRAAVTEFQEATGDIVACLKPCWNAQRAELDIDVDFVPDGVAES